MNATSASGKRKSARVDWATLRKTLVPERAESILPPSIKLPVLPKALMEFCERADDPEASVTELSRIIATDSGLSSDLLRRANSAQMASKTPVATVHQALVAFGVRATQLHLTETGMKNVMKSSSSQLVNFQNFWNTNLERAIFARELAEILGADGDLAYTACMLQDFLLPLITNQLLDDYLEYMEDPQQYGSLVAFEQQRFGWNHAEAAANVMCQWQFPDELICCVALHHKGADVLNDPELGSSSLAAVAVASLLPDALQQLPKSMDRLLELDQRWEGFDLDAIAVKVDEKFHQVAQDVQNHFSFLRNLRRIRERQKEAEA